MKLPVVQADMRSGALEASGHRHGFTLVEVLIAAGIMVIGLTGILSLAMNSVKRSDAPEQVQDAIKFAQERLDYFRAQPNPYRAAGGTWYTPPEAPDTTNYNDSATGANLNIVFNNAPALFVREYLYSFDEKRNGRDIAGMDLGRAAANLRATGDMTPATRTFGRNEIPPTPNSITVPPPPALNGQVNIIKGVVPNPDKAAPPTASEAYIYNGFTQPGVAGTTHYFTYMPRANDQLRATTNGMPLPPEIKYVREVWVQTSLPSFRQAGVDNRFPGSGWLASTNLSNPATLNGYAGAGILPPAPQPNLPPYTVAVTVRVFARDKQTTQISNADPGAVRIRLPNDVTGVSGPGYRRNKPLVTMVGYYGLRRFD